MARAYPGVRRRVTRHVAWGTIRRARPPTFMMALAARPMNDALLVSALSLVPKHAASYGMGTLARLRLPGPLLRTALRFYIWKYGVNLDEAERPLASYGSLVDFFTRALKPGLRPIDAHPDSIVSPADGTVYACGVVRDDRIPQSETQHFSAAELLGGEEGYEGGAYAVIYLSPRDYHRVHTPSAGAVTRFGYLPGALWPVFPAATRQIPYLFSRNERLCAHITTAAGQLALVMVGAFGVGRIRVVFDPIVSNTRGEAIPSREVTPAHQLRRGDEIGRFEMGSTVVLLFPPGAVEWTVNAGDAVRVGERIARLTPARMPAV